MRGPKKAPRKRKEQPPSDTAVVWRAYSLAYAQAYEVEPAHSARVMGQLSTVVQRIGW